MLAHCPLVMWGALVRAISSAFWEEVPTGRRFASTISVKVTTV